MEPPELFLQASYFYQDSLRMKSQARSALAGNNSPSTGRRAPGLSLLGLTLEVFALFFGGDHTQWCWGWGANSLAVIAIIRKEPSCLQEPFIFQQRKQQAGVGDRTGVRHLPCKWVTPISLYKDPEGTRDSL